MFPRRKQRVTALNEGTGLGGGERPLELEGLDDAVARAVVVGDSPVDILAGRAAGAWTVAASYGYGTPSSLQEAKPHATIPAFAGLPAVLKDLEARTPASAGVTPSTGP